MFTNRVDSVSYINPAFKSVQAEVKTTSPQTKPDEFVKERKISTGKMIAIGGGIVAAIALIIIGIKKGKGLPEAKRAVNNPAEELERLKQSSNLSIADFKRVGIFEKGKALIDGKGFTGTIEICKEKGTKKIYKNGILKESLRNGQRRIYKQDGKIKVFDNNGVLERTFYKDSNGAKIIFSKNKGVRRKLVLKPDGSVTEYEISLVRPNSQKDLDFMIKRKTVLSGDKVEIDKKTGRKKVSRRAVGEFYFDREKPKLQKIHKTIDGRKVTEYYDTKTKKLIERKTHICCDSNHYGLDYVENIGGDKGFPQKYVELHWYGQRDLFDDNPETINKILSGDKKTVKQILDQFIKESKDVKYIGKDDTFIFDM